MITRYSDAYDDLFKKAEARLEAYGIKNPDDTPISIGSLEEYFNHLADLLKGTDEHPIPENDREAGYIFLKLPLDEPYFEINANTRIITVPDEFKKNGCAAVKGDEVAEILFFEIDRYFDATDLSIMNIGIQWEHSSDATKKGYTPAFIRDIESEEDKLIFGWPITSAVTELADNLKFAVRFYSFDQNGENLDFSLTTQSATLKIVDSLNLNMKIEPDDPTELIVNRLFNSPVGTINPASIPVIEFYTPDNFELDQITDDITLGVLASKKDGGTLLYAWFKDEQTNRLTDFTSPGEKITGTYQFVVVNEAINNITTYYYFDTEINDYVKDTLGNKTFDELKQEHGGTLYVLCAVYTLTKDNVEPGEYYPKVKNRYYNDEAVTDDEQVSRWTVSGPIVPKIKTNLNNEYGYTDYNGAVLTVGMDSTTVISNAEIDINNTVYSWYKNDSENRKPTSDEEPFEKTSEPTITVHSQGYYMMRASNFKNNKTEEVDSTIVPVYGPIADFEINIAASGSSIQATLNRELDLPFEIANFIWTLTNDTNPIKDNVTTTGAISTFTGAESGRTYTVTVTLEKGTSNLGISKTLSKNIEVQ